MPTESEEKQIDDYINFLLELSRADQVDLGKLKIVVDANGGPIVPVLENLFKKINTNTFPVYMEGQAFFLGHQPRVPGPDDSRELQGQVLLLNADMGASFDQSGECLTLVDNKGRLIPSKTIFDLLLQATDDAHDAGISSDGLGRFYFKETGERPAPILATLKIIVSLSQTLSPLSHIVDHIEK